MNADEPRSLKGLKRRAKVLKRERGITHTAALELVAREMGYPNYRTALKVLSHEPTDE